MKLVSIQASAFKAVFEVLKDILNDVNVYFKPTGIRVITLDTARSALVDLSLNAENFEEYSCPEDVVAGLNISNTYKLLKTITNNDVIYMEIGNKEIPSHTIPTRIGETIPKAGREVDGRIPSKIIITLVSLVTRVVRVKVTTNGSLAVATLLEAEAATTHRVHGIRHHQHLMPIMAKVKAPITHPITKVASLVMEVKVHKVRARVRMARVQRYPSPRINREAVTQGKLGYPRSRGT